jgi:hypothetical protein
MRFQLLYDISYITLIVVLETFLFARGSGARLGTLNHERTVLNDEFPSAIVEL